MEAISNHLRLFSQGLFEEVMRFPYYTPKTVKPVNFQSVRLEKRRKRFTFIRDQALINRYAFDLLTFALFMHTTHCFCLVLC